MGEQCALLLKEKMDRVFVSGHKRYDEMSKTLRGVIAKSRAERQIANYFFEKRINYRYEDRANTTSSAFQTKIGLPDFCLPDYSAYVEYWGLMVLSSLRVID